jgi:hypothetical protein
METAWSPPLTVRHAHGRCRLCLGSYAYGDGDDLQDAADALVTRLLDAAMTWRAGGFRYSTELGSPDWRWFEFLHELGEIAAGGGDIRPRLFG